METYKNKNIKSVDNECKSVTEKCDICQMSGAIHKMSCPTQKTTVFVDDVVKAYYDQMEKEVHFNRGNLNK